MPGCFFLHYTVLDVVSELPSLTHAQLSEPSVQLTALPYTTDYTFMHNSQHIHGCLTTALASCQAVSLRVISGRVKSKEVQSDLSDLYPYSQALAGLPLFPSH